MGLYLNDFKDKADMIREFNAKTEQFTNIEILFANYIYEDYTGQACVIFKKDDKLFELSASHCSCYGLEDQWEDDNIKELSYDEVVKKINAGYYDCSYYEQLDDQNAMRQALDQGYFA